MSIAADSSVELSAQARSFLRNHQAEVAFERNCDLVRECYSGLRNLSAELRFDPDDAERAKLILWVELPVGASVDELLAQHEAYRERLFDTISATQTPLFGVLVRCMGN